MSDCCCTCPCNKVITKPEPDPLAFLVAAEITMVDCVQEAACADVVVVVGPYIPPELECIFANMKEIDKAFDQVITLFKHCDYPLPIIYSPTVEITPYHDVRVYHDAAIIAFERVLYAGFNYPLLHIPRCSIFGKASLVTALGALEALYVPLQSREEYRNSIIRQVEMLYLCVAECKSEDLCYDIQTLEPGRYVFRDLAMSDSERMTPIFMEDYIYELFKDGSILIEVICGPLYLKKEFPLFEAVSRAASKAVRRYAGRIILLEYVPECSPSRTILLVGKGSTFDTGGSTVKLTDMSGSSREKSGVANIVGFMKIVALIRPNFAHVVAALPILRNCIGEEGYVADEKVKNRAGLRIRFNNTDKEGRIAMSDCLTFLKEQVIARNLPDPHIFSLGTMTRHARFVAGPTYCVVLDNSVARETFHDRKVQELGGIYGEPFEISWLRKDEFDYNKGLVCGEDLIQSDCCTHTVTQRQHHIPTAFLIQSTLLSEHDVGSCFPIKYTHFDMEGSARNHPDVPASQPLFTLIKCHISEF